MQWKKWMQITGLATAMSIGLTACNTDNASYSPQQIIEQALQETEELTTYYGEYTMQMGEDAPIEVKEWVKDGKRRIELNDGDDHQITVNDGKQITSLDVNNNRASVFSIGEEASNDLGQMSLKKQAEMMLKMVKDSHDITVKGEETIIGRDTYHIVAKAKKEDTLLGDMEFWIDKKTWMMLKTHTKSAGQELTSAYTKLDTKMSIDEHLFTLTIPEDATVETFDDSFMPALSTLEEAKDMLGSFLLLDEVEGLELTAVTDMQVEERPEFSFEYALNGEPAYTVTVFKPTTSHTELGTSPEDQEIDIRGQKGTVMDESFFRYIGWEEDEYQYGIIIEHPDLTVEDAIQVAEQMKPIQ